MTLRMWSSLNESQKPRLHEKNGRFWSENVSFSRFCLVFFVFRGKFFLHFSIFLEKISKIHRKSCRALALDSVDLKNLSCCSIPRNDEDYLRRLIPEKTKKKTIKTQSIPKLRLKDQVYLYLWSFKIGHDTSRTSIIRCSCNLLNF